MATNNDLAPIVEGARMRTIEPDMVLGKEAVDGQGDSLGEVVDVGLYTHSRVKFLVVAGKERGGRSRTITVDAITDVSADVVRLRVA